MEDKNNSFNFFLIKRSEFFNEDGSLKEVHRINEMYVSLQEELKVNDTFLENILCTFLPSMKHLR